MQGPGRSGTASLDAACETTTSCEGGSSFCPVQASVITLVGLIAWVALSRATYLEPADAWNNLLPGTFDQVGGLLSIGLAPWVGVIVVLQILAACARPISEWLCGRTPCERADVRKWVGALAVLAFILAANARVAWLHTVTSGLGTTAHGAHAVNVQGPDVLAALLLGSLAAGALLYALQKAGPGFSFTLVAVFAAAALLAPRLATYAHHLKAHWFIGTLQLIVMVATGFLLVWLVGMTYEAPADLTPGGRDAPPIQVPVLVVGVLPLIASDLGVRVLRGAVRGLSTEFGIFGPLGRFTETMLAPGSILAAFVQLILVWILTTVTFSVLYPAHRLEAIFGLSRERIEESLESFLDGLLIQNALILCGVFVVSQLCGGTFAVLGLSSASFMVLIAGLAALRRNLLMRRALEEASGGLVPAKVVLGQLEGEVARARLAAAGIPSYLNAWTVQELHPVTIAGMGEVEVLVPHRVCDEAKKLLA